MFDNYSSPGRAEAATSGAIAAWDQRLADRLLAGIDPGHYRLVCPAAPGGPRW